MSDQIIPVTEQDFNGETVQVVDARTFHEKLGVKNHFRDWFPIRVKQCQLIENVDYFPPREKPQQDSHGGSNRKDYLLTLNAAKHVAMMENTDIGRSIRQYFIECEQQLKAVAPAIHASVYDQTMLPTWQRKAQAELEQIERNHVLVMAEMDNRAKEIAQVNAALDAKQVVIDQAQKVGVTVEVAASKNTIPTVPISTIMGKDMRADQANRILSKMGFIKQNPNKKGSIWEVTDKAANYGKNVKANKTGQSTNPGWFEGTDLKEIILKNA